MERNYETECESELDKDDADVIANRYSKFINALETIKNKENGIKKTRLKAQWTKMHDAVQEHFTSHVMINGTSHLLPPNIYALKQSSKQSWMLYKKRECERRKRLRLKIEKEKKIEESGGPANLLLSMVDACEVCRKFYITVNLFWGVTLCDVCYFNVDVISEIMKSKKKHMEASVVSSSSTKVVRHHPHLKDHSAPLPPDKWKEKYFIISEEPVATPSLTNQPQRSADLISPDLSSEEVIVEEDSCQFDEDFDFEDPRPISLYKGPPTPPGSPYNRHSSQQEESIQKICEDILNMPEDYDF